MDVLLDMKGHQKETEATDQFGDAERERMSPIGGNLICIDSQCKEGGGGGGEGKSAAVNGHPTKSYEKKKKENKTKRK